MEISLQAKEIRNAYQRTWRRKNAIKIKNYNVNYWEKKAMIQGKTNQEKQNPQTEKQDRQFTMNEIWSDLKSRSDL